MDNHELNPAAPINVNNEWSQLEDNETKKVTEKPPVQQLGGVALNTVKNLETDQGVTEKEQTPESDRISELLSRVPAEERGDLPALFEAVPRKCTRKIC